MRLFSLIGGLFLFMCLPLYAAAEEIVSFDVKYEIQTDASIAVTEVIAYDFGSEYRHGIFRTLKTTHAEPATTWYKDRFVEITDISVLANNQAVPFSVSGNNALEVKIGDADRTITGLHVYTISYTLTGALSYPNENQAEFYWNVTGNDWPVAIKAVSVSVTGDAPVTASSCYVGFSWSSSGCGAGSQPVSSYTTKNVPVGAEVTIAAMLDASLLPVVIYEEINFAPLLLGLFLLVFLGTMIHIWRYERHYHAQRPIIAEYEPYPGVEPMMAGVLVDDKLDAKDISAGVVYLAEQGFLKIRKTERKVVWLFDVTDYEVELLRPVSEIPGEFLPKIVSLFIKGTPSVGYVVALSTIKNNNELKRSNSLILNELNTAIRADLALAGFFEDQTQKFVKFLAPIAGVILAIVLGGNNIVPASFVWFIVGIFVLWILSVVAKDRRRTAKGYEAMYHLKGFKLFLSVTDKERFDFHNAPERSPEQFMQYLPYAIAFGVEEKWAALFADMQISNPSWYEDANAGGTFAAAAFTHDLSSFASTVTASTQASSGGGSSGGGGGGGGGGSW